MSTDESRMLGVTEVSRNKSNNYAEVNIEAIKLPS